MAHTVANKSRLIARIRRIKGQAEAVERALEADTGCAEVLMLVASLRGATQGLSAEVIEDHIRNHVADPDGGGGSARGAAELIEIVRTYLK
jgi:DNA-binding FrmR family transcriptional regulator